ncbi:MAG: protein kinase [Anaerolineaceae bacterium]|jgi:serine/threonine protein kinase
MAKLIQLSNARPVNPSEAQVIHYLVEKLPNTYTIIPNAEITQPGNPPYEYDAIVIAPHAVFVVEIKRWLGGIQGDDFTWVIAGLHHRPNPWITTNSKARVLKSTLDQRMPGVGRIWVDAVVAIVDEAGGLNLRGNCRQRVFRYTDLPAFLMDSAALEGKASDLRPLRGNLETAVQHAARGRQAGPLLYGNYRVLETLSRRDLVSEFLARNLLLPDSPPVRLRVFSYNPYLPADQLENHKALLRREAEALQKIGYHPNLIALRSFETAPEDPNLFLEVTDWSEGGTLRTLMNGTSPLSLERKLELAIGIAAGLKAAHAAGVIHRDLRPENILIGSDGAPRLMNFEHARLETPGAQTVGFKEPEPGISQAYMAPELSLQNPVVTPSSDLYSLGMILFELLVGDVLYNNPQQALTSPKTCTRLLDFVNDIPLDLDELVCSLVQVDAQKRPQETISVYDLLVKINKKPSGTPQPTEPIEPVAPENPVNETIDPAVYKVGDLIDGKYQVQKVLNAGGFGQVYKVYDGIFEKTYALKIFTTPNLSLESLQAEASALIRLDHPNIVKVLNWGRLPQSGRFYMVSEFVEGDELTHFITPDQRLSAREAVQIIIDLLSALEYLHPKVDRIEELREKTSQGEITGEEYEEFNRLQQEGWLHRDIKPNNLMLSPTGIKLIDFNIAARASQAGNTVIGTPGYMLPSVGMIRWTTEGDLFATAVVLYELITGHHPYPDSNPGSEEATDPRVYVPELNPKFAELLKRAVSCNDTVHYHSARRFRSDLFDLGSDYLQAIPVTVSPSDIQLEPDEIGRINYNPYVTRLLKLYSQARLDNSGTRGLDDIARMTYVQTRLDQALQPAILDGQYRLVIITGNAGDGKTAFIQSLEKAVEGLGGSIEHPTSNSSRFNHRGMQFIANYDGSQDEGAERANDQVLNEFFTVFGDIGFSSISSATPVHLIAINEGRLVDFFSDLWSTNSGEMTTTSHFHQLGACIQRFFEKGGEDPELPQWMLIVDLNQRSVVAPDSDQDGASIFDRQLQAFLKPEFWNPCQDCAFQTRCFIKYNVDTFSDSVSGPAVRARVRTLFEIIHLRRQLHITMRDLRSALSWMLFRDQSCLDIEEKTSNNYSPKERLNWFYYTAFGNMKEDAVNYPSADRLVRLLRQINPARVSNPELDRILYFKGLKGLPSLSFENRSSIVENEITSWILPSTWQSAQQPELTAEHLQRNELLRQVAFFERRDQGWLEMLPYRHLDDFKQAAQNQKPKDLKRKVARGFSFVEGARSQGLTEGFVCIRAGQNVKARVRSFRLFPLADFEIQIPPFQGDHYLEYTNQHFTFVHDPNDSKKKISNSRKADLTVSLDLLELLEEINGGYIPSPDDISGIFINLLTFKNALAHLPYNRVLLTRDDKRYYELTQGDQAKLRLQVWQPEGQVSNEN